ncbi:MAG: hypothetical protein CM1200mP2_39600 [Planctomycetaceae bacterium]|nr:MAG: hypothetical protein CM1200mP2_39600 [Planctomycetaceae bacterium]
MTDDATATDPIFSAAEVAAFEESDKSVGKAIGLMLAAPVQPVCSSDAQFLAGGRDHFLGGERRQGGSEC